MNAIHFLVRTYCRKSFKLPKINFIYKNVEGSENKEISRSHSGTIIRPNSAKKYDSFKNNQSRQKNSPRIHSASMASSSVENITDNETQRRQYSRDLFEVEHDDGLNNKFNKRKVAKTMGYVSSWRNNQNIYPDRDKRVSKSHFHMQEDREIIYGKRVSKSHFQIQEDREIVYGIFPVLFALQTKKRSFYKLYIKQNSSTKNEKVQLIQEICIKNNISTQFVSKAVLQQLTNFDAVHQGVCLEASRVPMFVTDENNLESLGSDNSSTSCWMYLNGINDPMNLGAIIRTAYFLGVEKVMSSAANSCPVTSVVSKASAGIAELYPIYTVPNDESYLLACQKLGWQIVSSSSSYIENSVEIESFHPKKNVLLVIGNEGRGISKEILELSDVCVSIPPHETCSSDMLTLNASVASSIILFSVMSKLKLLGGN